MDWGTEMTADETNEFEPITHEFVESLRLAMGSPAKWEHYMHPERIKRTEAGLGALLRSLNNQIKAHGDHDDPLFDPDWFRRVSGLRSMTMDRIRSVRNALGTVTVGSGTYDRLIADVVSYKDFAWALAIELDKSDRAYVLDELEAPRGGITAGEWMERRTRVIESEEE